MSSNDVAKLGSERAVRVAGEEQRKPAHPLGLASGKPANKRIRQVAGKASAGTKCRKVNRVFCSEVVDVITKGW